MTVKQDNKKNDNYADKAYLRLKLGVLTRRIRNSLKRLPLVTNFGLIF